MRVIYALSGKVLLIFTLIILCGPFGCAGNESNKQTGDVQQTPKSAVDEFSERNPAAQGFYPAGAEALGQMVKDLLGGATKVASREVIAIMTPHAGYTFSGMVAAAAFRYASGRSINTIILIGPSHHMAFPGFAIWRSGVWRMPGFDVSVDADFCKLLLADNSVKADIQPHLPEHSLEVQLPFIHALWPLAQIVPIIVGIVSQDEATALEKSLAKACGSRNDVLMVATCDLSHYHPREQAKKLDDKAAELMASFDGGKLLEADATHQIEIDAPMVVVLAQNYARDMGARTAITLMRRDSGDATGDTSAVVGYGAFAYER